MVAVAGSAPLLLERDVELARLGALLTQIDHIERGDLHTLRLRT
jgi:hypothetical protein